MLRQEESQQITGATYVLAGGLLCSLLALISESACAAAFLGFTLFVLGDAAAALAGKAFGRVRVGRKTLEGALGCYLLCVVLGAFLFPQLPTFLAVWGGDSVALIFLILESLHCWNSSQFKLADLPSMTIFTSLH